MSPLTVTDTLSVPEALAVVRDILAQTDGDAVVAQLLDPHASVVLRVVGPLGEPASGTRYSLFGIVGFVTGQGADRPWIWGTTPEAHRWTGRKMREIGTEPTRAAADAALCQALTALGWHCVGAP